ncbi:MAG: endo-1,4-beta-xylanase [Janthinobacterium lividum]
MAPLPTRRTVLQQLAGCASVAAGVWTPRLFAQQAGAGQQKKTTDDMMQNTAQTAEHFPPPDFGPAPGALPAEARAVAGPGSLRAHAAAVGRLFGCAVVVRQLERDPALRQLVGDQAAILVPEGELKWVALRPAADRFDFEQADTLFRFAAEHRRQVRGHTLVWHNSVPTWLQASPASTDVRALLVEHIRAVVGRYRGRVHSWDVVNEAILPKDGAPGGLRRSFWYERVGPDYIELAFRTAHEADPKAILTYNDYGVEYDNPEETERRAAILALLRDLRAKGVPVQAVGIQSHIKAAAKFSIGDGLKEYMDAVAAMGLPMYLTELDVNEDDVASNDPAVRDAEVAATYTEFLDVALANPSVKAVLCWGLSDRRTWLNDGPTHHRKQPGRPQRSLPFDPQYRPTAAFFAARASFDAAPVAREI